MKHFYEKDIFISKDVAAKINKACSTSYPKDWFSEDETPFTLTAKFVDGMTMDIRCCGSQDAPSWCESILWAPDENGSLHEINCSGEVCDSILGNWEMVDPYTENEYIVNVKIEEEKEMPTNKKLNEMIIHDASSPCHLYATVDTPNGQFRIFCEPEEGYHGVFISFIRDGQDVEQDICMAEIDPDDKSGNTFSVKVWSEPQSEEYQEDIHFGQYREPRCPYCGNWGVIELDDFGDEIMFYCPECNQRFLMDINTGKYSTCNHTPLKPFEEKEKEQE